MNGMKKIGSFFKNEPIFGIRYFFGKTHPNKAKAIPMSRMANLIVAINVARRG